MTPPVIPQFDRPLVPQNPGSGTLARQYYRWGPSDGWQPGFTQPLISPIPTVDIPVLKIGTPANETDRQTFAADDWQAQLYERAKPAIVQIFVGDGKEDPKLVGSATGFFVTPTGMIATDAHVLMGHDKFKVRLSDGRVYDATAAALSSTTDLGILQTQNQRPNETFQYLPLAPAERPFNTGQKVIAVGHPLGYPEVFLSEGTVNGLILEKDIGSLGFTSERRTLVDLNIHTEHGSSGSPILNQRGEVVGIDDRIGGLPGHEYAATVADLRPLVPGYPQNSWHDFIVPREYRFANVDLYGPAAATTFGAYNLYRALQHAPSPLLSALSSGALMSYGATLYWGHDRDRYKLASAGGSPSEKFSAGLDVGLDLGMFGAGAASLLVPARYRLLLNGAQVAASMLRMGDEVMAARQYH
jgi:hypothetical protein